MGVTCPAYGPTRAQPPAPELEDELYAIDERREIAETLFVEGAVQIPHQPRDPPELSSGPPVAEGRTRLYRLQQ